LSGTPSKLLAARKAVQHEDPIKHCVRLANYVLHISRNGVCDDRGKKRQLRHQRVFVLASSIICNSVFDLHVVFIFRERRCVMTPLKLAEGLAEEIKEVVYRYSDAMPLATAIGVLEIVKAELMQEHLEEDHDQLDT
jgi:hypothetical protein